LKFHPYDVYLLALIELALHSGVTSSSAAGGPLKKTAKIATASAFQDEVQSPLGTMRKGPESSCAKPYAARAFIDTHEIDASKLEHDLKAVDVKPTFDSLTKSIYVTYDLFEVAAMRMKASITAVTLQMKTTLSAAERIIRAAEGCKTPKTR
jgi:hypothetical protein